MKTSEVTTANVFEHPLNENPEVQEAFTEFILMRKKMRKPATERAVKLLLVTLIKLSDGKADLAVKIIDRSITNCWLDFYQLKEEDSIGFETPQQRAERLKREDGAR